MVRFVGVVALALAVVGCGTAATPTATVCTMPMPATVGVSADPMFTMTVPSDEIRPGQTVRRWQTRLRTVEMRWPPSPRALFADRLPTADDDLIDTVQVAYANHVHMLIQPPGAAVPIADIDVLIDDVRAAETLPAACQWLSITVSDERGQQQTVGVQLVANAATGPRVEDRGPLVVRRFAAVLPLRRDEIQLCLGVHAQPRPVDHAPVMPTAAEALDAFLSAPQSSAVPRSLSWRPFDAVSSTSIGAGSIVTPSVRFEHFVAWTQFVSIEVVRVPTGWVVEYWLTGTC